MSVPVQEQVLDTAARIASSRPDWRFELAEIVRDLRHLNERTVRTHVVSRCCVNAPKNHLHKWPYFRRVGRGQYEVLPPYRRAGKTRQAASPDVNGVRPPSDARTAGKHSIRRQVIHAVAQKDEAAYVLECLELPVVTQGRTFDEAIENLQEALALHLDGEDMEALGLDSRPWIQITYDIPVLA